MFFYAAASVVAFLHYFKAFIPDTPDSSIYFIFTGSSLYEFPFCFSSAFETASVHNMMFCHRPVASFLVFLFSEFRRTYVFTALV
jgi:hypothetical protein